MAREVLICENEDCAYRFSEAETSFLCCPKCGTLVSSNFARVNLEDRARRYGEILSFRKHLRISERIKKVADFLTIPLAIADGFRYWYTGAAKVLDRDSFVFSSHIQLYFGRIIFPLIIYVYLANHDSNVVYKHFLREKMWVLHTIKAKVIMGTILYTLLFLLLRYHAIFHYWRVAYLLGKKWGVLFTDGYVKQEVPSYYCWLLLAVFYATYGLWDDWYSRYLCENMSPKVPRRFNRWG